MWSDNETTKDLIGFKTHADLIKSIATDINILPITIGVFGDWGSGKTSVMRMLADDLDPENYPADSEERKKYGRFACLYFNGWLFEGYDDAKSAILSSILLELGEHKLFGSKVKEKVGSLLKSVNWMRVVRLGLSNVALPTIAAFATGGVSIVPSLLNLFGGISNKTMDRNPTDADNKETLNWQDLIKANNNQADPLDVRTFRERFSSLIKDSEIDALIVIIDDLDRCSPERIIDNLEAIKLFLNVERTAFIIGADPRIVKHAISNRYSMLNAAILKDSTDQLTVDYLEKIIQVPYYLPKLSPAEVETYMSFLFCSNYLIDNEFDKCLTAWKQLGLKNRYSVFGYADIKNALGSEPPEELSTKLNFCSKAAPLVTECLKGNPRQVKRFLNSYTLRKEFAKTANLEFIKDEVLVKLMILEYVNLDQFKELYNWQANQEGFPEEIKKMEKIVDSGENVKDELLKINSKWGDSLIIKWLSTKPNLSNIDLRDYFWISRDRLQETFSGVSFIAPLVRKSFDDLTSGNPGKLNSALFISKELNEQERSQLLSLLEKQVKEQPTDKKYYDPFLSLIEGDFPGSLDSFCSIMKSVPTQSIPPAIGTALVLLTKSKPSVKSSIQILLDNLQNTQTKTKFGTAIEKAQKPNN